MNLNWRKLIDYWQVVASIKERERGPYYLLAQIGIVGTAERVAERRIDEQGAWRIYLLRYFSQHSDRHGWDAGLFDHALYQSDGLMAQRSDRREEHSIDAVLFQERRDLGRGVGGQARCGRSGAPATGSTP